MAGMRNWPKSRWTHAALAFAPATVLAIIGAAIENRRSFAEAVRQYPHDGLDGLGALWDGLVTGLFIGVTVFLIFFLFQKRFAAPSE
jgi:hypothetical protein